MSEELFTSANDEFCAELSKLLKHIQCSICHNLMVKPVVTQCLHRFCGECIARSIQSNTHHINRCPVCCEQIIDLSLREQNQLNDVIIKCTNTIDVLKNDHNLSKFFDNTVLNSLNDSTIAQNIDNNCNQNKENVESIVEQNISELESNEQKSVTIDEPMQSWPSIDSIRIDMNDTNDSNNTEKLSETRNDRNLSNSPLNLSSDHKQSNNFIELINDNKHSNVEKMNTNQSTIQSNSSLQSKTEHLIVNRSSVSFSYRQKPKLNDIFDKIIEKSTKTHLSSKKTLKPLNSNRKRKMNKPNRRYNILMEDKSDVDLDSAKNVEHLVEPISKSNQQNQTSKSATNLILGNVNENNSLKRIRNIESSDDQMIDKRIKLNSTDVESEHENRNVDASDDELMFSIHSYNDETKDSSNLISSDVSMKNNMSSQTPSLRSSPIIFDPSFSSF